MRKMILLFSHDLTEEQRSDAKERLGVEEFVALPEDIQKLWSNIPAVSEDIADYLAPIQAFVEEVSSSGDVVLVQGDFGATYAMVNFCKSLDLLAVHATTKRNVVEREQDGKIVKTSVFEHVLFRKY